MKHPLVVFVAAVLSGILIGVNETPPPWRAACLFMTVIAVLKAYRKCRDLRKKTLLFCALFVFAGFICGFLRAFHVSEEFSEGEKTAFFRKYEATNPGEFDYALYLKSLGISDEAARKRLKEKEPDPGSWLEVSLDRLNRKAGSVLDGNLSEHDAGIMRAMLLGDKSEMDTAVKELYQSSGIAHLLAVSGLHVSLIGMSLYSILRKKVKVPVLASVITASVATFAYSLFTGGSGSSLRAAIMLIISLLAILSGRTYDLVSSLSIAAVILLLWRPYMILQNGFQLSFGAIVGIFAGSSLTSEGVFRSSAKDEGIFNKALKMILPAFSVTMFTLPTIAADYFYIPMYSVLLNVIVIPLMTVVMVSGILTLFSGMILPAGRIRGLVSLAFSAPGHYVLKLYEILCDFTARLPYSGVLLGKAGPWQVIIYYILLCFVITVLRRACLTGSKRILAGVCGIILLLILPSAVKYHETDGFYVCAVDVGQGDCFHIHYGKTDVLIDGGCSGYDKIGPNTIEPYLLSKGISRISLVIVSHADSDHINGIEYLISEDSKVEVERIMLPAMAKKDDKYKTFLESEIPVQYSKKGEELRSDNGILLKCLYSAEEGPALNDTNRQSSVYLLGFKGFRMLFTGDITKEDEMIVCSLYEEGADLKGIDVLKAAHHGSKTATSETFVDRVRPEYALLSYGEGNRFGHPHEETLVTLSEHGVKVLETAKMGAVTIKVNEDGYSISGFREKGG
ncbi:MAG: DNA internalization-related competence protein ComEC/Rec2 [Lachnospiraceae bacterium]|nr:DNA internalization-related competence protein ComEC/Rec2 [Lachnospiraceae bacterium]